MTETSNTAQTLRNIRILQLLGFLIVVGLAVLIYRDATRPVAPVPDAQPANAQGLPEESDLIAASRQVPPEKIFDFIYKEKFWGANAEGQGHSGPGSTVDATLIYRTFLQDFLKVHEIRSVVDAGCGDWEFSRTVDWSGIDYKGFDIVADVIKSNTEKYSKSNVSFAVANMVEDPLPPADLLIVKHVLQHIPNRDVLKFLPQLKKYKHVLLVNSADPATLSGDNQDTTVGGYRHLELTRPPFNLKGNKVLAYTDHVNAHVVLHLFQRHKAPKE